MVGLPQGGSRKPDAADVAVAFGILALVAIAPAFLFARMEVRREAVLGDRWRARTVASALATEEGGARVPLVSRALRQAGPPTPSVLFLRTSGGTDEFGIAQPARLVALDPEGRLLEAPEDLRTRFQEAAGKAQAALDEGQAPEACLEDGERVICAVVAAGGQGAGAVIPRSRATPPWTVPLGVLLAGCLGLSAFRPLVARRPRLGAGVAGFATGGVAAVLLSRGAERLLADLAASEATLAKALAASALPAHEPALGVLYVVGVALVAGALAAGLVPSLAQVLSDLRGRPWLYLSIAPAMVGMILLIFVPFFMGVYLAFLDNQGRFVGLANFVDILVPSATGETRFWFTLGVTVMWTFLNVALHVAIGLALALVLSDARLRGKAIYRVLLIVPWAVPNYITALVWKWIFNTQYGPANALLAVLGMSPVDWLGRSFWTNFSANLVTNTWLGFPFMMVISLGALQSIPADLYEAAEMDGAGRWQRFRHITLPLLKPALVPAIVLGTIWTFNMFNVVYLVSGGAPDNQTNILITEAYRAFRVLKNHGLAAAYSLIIFLILAAWTAVTNRVTRAAENVYE
ncbi:sugar ABC transporter permease [Myxococcota bacterium]|nr:sugar ABC transporter permease [Myxococcota bacterium]